MVMMCKMALFRFFRMATATILDF